LAGPGVQFYADRVFNSCGRSVQFSAAYSPRLPLIVKEYLSLSLFIIFSFYLSLTHDIAKVLLASFILPIFASTLFLNVKITRWMFWISSLAVLLLGVKMYFSGRLDSDTLMQIFVVCFMCDRRDKNDPNTGCEGFFGRLKNEFFYCRPWRGVTIEVFIRDLDAYINWYNEKRIKTSLGGMSPLEYRRSLGLVA